MRILTLLAAAVLLCLSTVTIAGGTKAEVCHIPPGSPAEFHTITVNGKAVEAHLGHGDFEGSCGTYAGVLCDDGDMCTQDRFYDGTDTCEANVQVDTDDGNSCTADSCDPATGNVNTALADGTACDDGGAAGTCTAGVCGSAAPLGCNDPTATVPCEIFGYEGCCPDGLTCHFANVCPGDAWQGYGF